MKKSKRGIGRRRARRKNIVKCGLWYNIWKFRPCLRRWARPMHFGVELLSGHCVSAKGAVVGARCITARHRHSERGGNDKIPQVAESARIGDDFGLVFYRKAVYNFYNKRKEDKKEKKHETLYCNRSMQSLRGLHGGIAPSGNPQALLLFFT